jgi:hypothetical protein
MSDVSKNSNSSKARGTRVAFSLEKELKLSSAEAWRRLIDWEGHGKWIPMTKVDVDPNDRTRFVAWTGIRPLVLEDRMHQLTENWDGTQGDSRVAKLGPVLVGEAEFSVKPGSAPQTAIVAWREDVRVPYLPKFLSPLVGWAAKQAFAFSIKKMVTKG